MNDIYVYLLGIETLSVYAKGLFILLLLTLLVLLLGTIVLDVIINGSD